MDEKLTDAEVAEMTEKLQKHFGQPVLPMSRFCNAIRIWFRAVETNNTDPGLTAGKAPDALFGSDYFKHLRRIEIDISKSNLLARLLYGGEPLRTEKCPAHGGHWDGHAQVILGCTYGCEGTGWLKTPERVQSWLAGIRRLENKTDAEIIALAAAGKFASTPANYAEERLFRRTYEWLYHLGRIDLVPEKERG